MGTGLLTPEIRQRKQIKTARGSGWLPGITQLPPQPQLSTCSCSTAQLHTRVKPVAAEDGVQLWGTEPAGTLHSIQMGRGQGQQIKSSLNSDWRASTAPAHTLAQAKHPLWHLLLQHCSPREGASPGSGGSAHLEQNQRGPNPQGCCSSLGSQHHPKRAVMATEKRSSSSHLALAPAPPSLAPPPTEVTAASAPWGKT